MAKNYRRYHKKAGRKKDGYEQITEQIIAALDKGIVPWHKPWAKVAGHDHQNLDGIAYRGINTITLNMMASINGYTDPRWGTYKSIAAKGGFVKGGEKGTKVIWIRVIRQECKPLHGEEELCNTCLRSGKPNVDERWSNGVHTVFNVEQAGGLELPALDTVEPIAEFNPIEAAEAIVAGYKDRPSISYRGNSAFYTPSMDSITLPEKWQFDGEDEYYSTLFHELTHSTGHKKRIGRHELEGVAPFGSKTYSKEELVAEFGNAFLCHESGISSTLDNSAAYIQGWAEKLRSDKKLVYQAAKAGQQAANYIQGIKENN